MANLLEVEGLHAHYDKSHILHGVSMVIASGEIVSLLGRNGSGRSTTLKAIMGLVPPTGGRVDHRCATRVLDRGHPQLPQGAGCRYHRSLGAQLARFARAVRRKRRGARSLA